MQVSERELAEIPPTQTIAQTIAVAATFTAEPLEESLAFWMGELGLPYQQIEFAPYNQIFQQLLDPTGLLMSNRDGINVLLVRFEDWVRTEETVQHKVNAFGQIERNAQELINSLQVALPNSSAPLILCFCPDSPELNALSSWQASSQQLLEQITTKLTGTSGLYLIQPSDFAAYPVEEYHDVQRDRLGHIPFTAKFFTALGTVLSRKIYAIKSPPHKVIVLDCDNTLWKGVVGEDGVPGIGLGPEWQELQQLMLAQQQAGMLLCLCSKNNEPDVMEVFQQRQDMVLKLDNLVAWRVNWLPKSENIKSLAQELNLGLDSFIFIDDNPLECAEVQAACPEVLTLQLPETAGIPQFLRHVWAFDRLQITEEDRQRTNSYKQNIERNRLQQQALTIADFLASLELQIDIGEFQAAQLSRVSQLTQRTNQFNITTIRRSEADIQQLLQSGVQCQIVEVRDRFGDYGLVGVLFFSLEAEALLVDTLLLSCRVLGRGVEYRIVNYLGEIAEKAGLPLVKIPFIPTKKNLPALKFLQGIGSDYQLDTENGSCFALPAAVAATLSYDSQTPQDNEVVETSTQKSSSEATAAPTPSRRSVGLNRIATELAHPDQVLQAIGVKQQARRLYSEPDSPVALPQTPLQQQLAEIWREVLHLTRVSLDDNYFELGGTSLLAVEVIARTERQVGRQLPLTTLVEAPTIRQFAALLDQPAQRGSLVLLNQGGASPPLFLVHDGDGETMLYRNLAQSLQPARAVYGLQPLSGPHQPILHTRIPDMAAYYIEQIRTVQPQGPYLLGGMCAGGVVAFEMARQLEQQGERVAMVAMMDAADVEAAKISQASIRFNRFSQSLNQQDQGRENRLLHILKTVWRKGTNLITYEVKKKSEDISNQVRINLFRYCLDHKLPIPGFLQQLSVRKVYGFAERSYLPDVAYQGELLLLRATEYIVQENVSYDDTPYIQVYSDPLLGWQKRTTQPVRVYDLPGGHSTMLQVPYVQVMAEKLQAYIAALPDL